MAQENDPPEIDVEAFEQAIRDAGRWDAPNKVPSEGGKPSNSDEERKNESLRAQVHLEGLQAYYGHRKLWSIWLLRILIFLVAFQTALDIAIGLGWLDFSKYPRVLEIQAYEYFGQVVSLCVIVVGFLFDKKAALNQFRDDPNDTKK